MKNLKTKYFTPTLNFIERFTEDETFKIDVPKHHLDKCILKLKKSDGQFSFETISPIQAGVQKHKEIQFKSEIQIKLVNEHKTLYSKGSHYFVNNINYIDHHFKLSTGSITLLSSNVSINGSTPNFLRCVIPVGTKNKLDLKDFQKTLFKIGNSTSFLFTCNVNGHNFDLINCKKNDFHYFIIDCLEPINKKEFQKKCYNIILAIGLMKGDLILKENYILSYDNNIFEEPHYIEFLSMRSSVYSNQPLITTNPYSVRIFDEDFDRDENGMISEAQRNELYKGIVDISSDVFSNLTTLFCKYEKLQRATLLYILGHSATLEIRIPNYYVALEAITSYLVKYIEEKPERLNPIKDKKIANELILEIKELIEKKKNDNELADNEMNIDILFKNVERLNSPPNADKLAKSFEIIDFTLTDEQFKMIKNRNSYLHGSFIKTKEENERFKDALHLSLRLHFLVGVLLLKNAGYTGKIINYAKLWSHITEKNIDEEVLVNI